VQGIVGKLFLYANFFLGPFLGHKNVLRDDEEKCHEENQSSILSD